MDRLLEQARAEQDQIARYEIYHRVEEMVLEDAPWIPIWYGGRQYVLVKPYVKDYVLTSLVVPVLRHVYLTAE